jgi:hypothetical protein
MACTTHIFQTGHVAKPQHAMALIVLARHRLARTWCNEPFLDATQPLISSWHVLLISAKSQQACRYTS